MNLNYQLLNKRQDWILKILEKKELLSISLIKQEAENSIGKIAKITINRDIQKLKKMGFIVEQGKGRGTIYKLSPHYNLIKPINVNEYFKTETDKRIIKERFNFDIFSILKNLFTDAENQYLADLNKKYQGNLKNIPENVIKKEFERLMIELSWKSSQIEGNTYTLLETEFLIKENKEAKGHKKEEVIMILNHKEALDYIKKNKSEFKIISVSKIEHIHQLLTENLGISRNIRKSAVGIVGTKYKPFDNEFQIKENIEKTCNLINQEKNPFAKALLLSIMIAYIQPFEDGNKRTSRLMGNAVLMAYDICPLSYRNVDEIEYKKAVILFYEQNNINYFKQLFIEQFEFAIKNYFTNV